MLFINSKQKEKMSEDESNKTSQPLVDLSELSNLQFQTAWTPSSNIGDSTRPSRGKEFKKSFRRKDFSKDAPERRRPRYESKAADGDDSRSNFKKRPFKKFAKGSDKKKPYAPFVFTMDVQIFPEDVPFNKLSEIIKASKRTYQLFDIAHLILEKRERMVILAKNLPDSDNIVKPLFCAQPLNIPFEDEASAKNAALEYKFEEMFEPAEIEAEPPKGTFTVVNRCKLTGDLIGAPNWHLYQKALREYHKEHFAKMPYDAFLETIESVKSPEAVNQWLEQTKTKKVYKLKNAPEGQEKIFETPEEAKKYIDESTNEEFVKVYEQVRMNASNIDRMPMGRIRRNMEEAIRKEKRFPIETANNMRGKLRRSGFAVYKRGSKGYAFVSLIKRKFLTEGETLAECPQKIFDFVLMNPAIKAAEVPYKFLGMEVPAALVDEKGEGTPQTSELTDEQKADLNAVYSELSWLISEGYVVEYSDTTLQANPYLPKPKDKSQKAVSEPVNDEPVEKPQQAAEDNGDKPEDQAKTSEESTPSEEAPACQPADEPHAQDAGESKAQEQPQQSE